MFIDEVEIKVISWKWWDWLVSWRREKYIPKWGPWGWDWWKWWDVIIETTTNLNTLSEYRHKKVLKAQNGERGWTNTCHWANAPDLILKVPVWTIITDLETWEKIADLSEDKTRLVLVKWWKWGFWNAHFCSSTRQAPAFAELWDIAQEKNLKLELKLVADIGIIWIPSAGKSTLINKITNVEAKIWDYPFTTITPNLGVLDYKWKSLVLEDVPWLIPGAHEWKGLWIEFLKHIERTGVLIHLLDSYRLDKVFQDYEDIRKELDFFSEKLKNKEEIIVFSKWDLLDQEMKTFLLEEFSKKYPDKKTFIISSATWEGIEELKDFLIDNYVKEKQEIIEVEKIKFYDLKENKDPRKVEISYQWDLLFKASWERIEQIVRMTDFDNLEAVMRVYDVLDKMNIIKEIEEKLAKIMEKENIDNSFFFEWNDDKGINPRVEIAWKIIELNKLKYNL